VQGMSNLSSQSCDPRESELTAALGRVQLFNSPVGDLSKYDFAPADLFVVRKLMSDIRV
jgi:hypothetical protein